MAQKTQTMPRDQASLMLSREIAQMRRKTTRFWKRSRKRGSEQARIAANPARPRAVFCEVV